MATPLGELGLAGAEKELYALNLNAGQLQVQRSLLQLRVDYLSELNTQTMLLAGCAVGMLSSLELEAIEGEDPEERALSRTLLCAQYIVFTSISLGASFWVLYASNNLVNLATMTILHAAALKDVQGADSVLSLRMRDVRRMYVLALGTLLPALYTMVVRLIDWYISVPGFAIVVFAVLHAIHSDLATYNHFEQSSGIPLGSGFDYSIYSFLTSAFARMLDWLEDHKMERTASVLAGAYQKCIGSGATAYSTLEGRLRTAHLPPSDASRQTLVGLKVPKESYHAYMLKTPSGRGPTRLLESVAVAASPASRISVIQQTPAVAPTNKRWWVLEGRVLSCYSSEKEWQRGAAAELSINLKEYMVLKAYDIDKFVVIALLPKLTMQPEITHAAEDELRLRSWYLSGYPANDRSSTYAWLEKLLLASGATSQDGTSQTNEATPRVAGLTGGLAPRC